MAEWQGIVLKILAPRTRFDPQMKPELGVFLGKTHSGALTSSDDTWMSKLLLRNDRFNVENDFLQTCKL